MGASAGLPLGPLPVLKKATRPFSPQRCHRRLPLVRSGDVLCQPLTGSMGWMFSTAPFNHFSLSNWPSGDLGVWHSWQRATSSTRYLPRATLSDCANRAVETASSVQRFFIAVHVTTKSSARCGCGLIWLRQPYWLSNRTGPGSLLQLDQRHIAGRKLIISIL